MSMSQSWSYNRNPKYKSTRMLIHTLVDVVSKGGNFLVGVGPGPDGRLDDEAYERMAEIGEWMQANGEAIYSSRQTAPYASGRFRFTTAKSGDAVYAVYLAEEGENRLPEVLRFAGHVPAPGRRVILLETGDELPWETVEGQIMVGIPDEVREGVTGSHAWTLKIEGVEE